MAATVFTDKVAWLRSGTQSFHPEAVEVDVDGAFITKDGESVRAIALTFVPVSGNTGHWLALSPDQAEKVANEMLRSVREARRS